MMSSRNNLQRPPRPFLESRIHSAFPGSARVTARCLACSVMRVRGAPGEACTGGTAGMAGTAGLRQAWQAMAGEAGGWQAWRAWQPWQAWQTAHDGSSGSYLAPPSEDSLIAIPLTLLAPTSFSTAERGPIRHPSGRAVPWLDVRGSLR